MPITKIPDLSLAATVEAVIALAQIALPVLPFAVNNTTGCKDQDTDLSAKIDGMAVGILRCVFAGICPVQY
jgi:hypothetical protein